MSFVFGAAGLGKSVAFLGFVDETGSCSQNPSERRGRWRQLRQQHLLQQRQHTEYGFLFLSDWTGAIEILSEERRQRRASLWKNRRERVFPENMIAHGKATTRSSKIDWTQIIITFIKYLDFSFIKGSLCYLVISDPAWLVNDLNSLLPAVDEEAWRVVR